MRFALTLSFLAAGCAADINQMKVLLDDRIVDIRSRGRLDLDKNGVAFMSLGTATEKCAAGGYSISFIPVPSGTPEARFYANTSNILGTPATVIKAPAACVEVVGMTLPPGDYQMTKGLWSLDLGTTKEAVRSDRFLGAPFTVRAGQIAYLGSFQMVFQYGEGLFGKKVLSGGEYGVVDEKERDLGKLLEIRPEPKAIPVKAEMISPRSEVNSGGAIAQ